MLRQTAFLLILLVLLVVLVAHVFACERADIRAALGGAARPAKRAPTFGREPRGFARSFALGGVGGHAPHAGLRAPATAGCCETPPLALGGNILQYVVPTARVV
jgi:hypothetical protein